MLSCSRLLSASCGTLMAGFFLPVSLIAAPPALRPLGEPASLTDAGGARVFSPAASFAPDGSLVVAWESELGGVLSRRLDREGGSSGPPATLAANRVPGLDDLPYKGPGTVRKSPAIAVLPDGSFLLVWTEEDLHLDVWIYKEERTVESSRIFAQRFDRSSKALGTPVAIGGAAGQESEPQLATLAGGDVLVVWQIVGGGQDGIYARALSPELEPRGEPFRVDDREGQAGAKAGVAAAADGFLVTWESCCDGGADAGIFARRFEAAGKPAGASFPVNATSAGAQSLPVVVASPGGGYLVAWLGPAGDAGRGLEVFARRVGAQGEAVGEDRAVSGAVGREPTRPGLVADSDGYVVAWSTGPGRGKGVFVRRLDESGAASGEPVQVSVRPPNYERHIALAWDGGQRYGVAWGGFDGADHASINGRILTTEAPAR